MSLRIDRDANRFREIVRGRVRQNLRKFMSQGEIFARTNRGTISIPLPQLDIPHFRYGDKGNGGVGQGAGEIGEPIGRGDQLGGEPGAAGSDPGEHVLEAEFTPEELASLLAEELGLPRITPKGNNRIIQERQRYKSIRRVGPESLRSLRRTFLQALKRQMAEGVYAPDRPVVIPFKEDRRYRSWDPQFEPITSAVAIYMMDVSGSMTDEQKSIVRTEAFWIDTWLRSHYKGLQRVYIIHDAVAREVDEETFYRTRENGGTRISSAYRVCEQLFAKKYSPADWNIYCFQFSDGDNWGEDNRLSIEILRESILPHVNLFCYGQVASPYGTGEYLKTLAQAFGPRHEKLSLSEIRDRDEILASIKTFLGKGK